MVWITGVATYELSPPPKTTETVALTTVNKKSFARIYPINPTLGEYASEKPRRILRLVTTRE
jgi:hypothetical protein